MTGMFRAAQVTATALCVVALVGCGGDAPSPMPTGEVIQIGQDCFGDRSGRIPNGFEQIAEMEGCVDRLAADPLGRLYLIGAVNADLALVILQHSEDIGRGTPSEGLQSVTDEVQQGDLIRVLEDVDFVHASLVWELREHRSGREMAVEMGGLLSMLPRFTASRVAADEDTTLGDVTASFIEGDDALARTRAAVARVEALLPEDDWEDEFVDLASAAVAEGFAVALWAQAPVRDALIAEGASDPPTSAGGIPIDPPLVDAGNVLRVPEPDDKEASEAFASWYRDGGGKPLRLLAMSFPEKVRIEEQLADEATPLIPTLFSFLLDPEAELSR